MEIKDLISFYVNESSHTLDVTFRLDSDRDDEVRTDQIGFDEIKNFGYNFLDDKIDVYRTLFEDESFEDEEDFDSDIFEDIFSESDIDEQEIISFLNEYYLIYNTRLPESEIYSGPTLVRCKVTDDSSQTFKKTH
jgi:hypothetical protein